MARHQDALAQDIRTWPNHGIAVEEITEPTAPLPRSGAPETRRTSQPGNLPAELDVFVGRHRELAEGQRLLERARLVTLTGPGGIGKTRLALRLAAEAARRSPASFPDGVWLISLSECTEPEQIPTALADVLGPPVGAHPSSADLDALLAGLRLRRLLLVVDNCEHLAEPTASLLRRVLQAAEGARVLATSRTSLQVPGEHLLPVLPLDSTGAPDAAGAASSEAVQLLQTQARAVNAELRDEDFANANRLCQLLNGVPLAITLAATQLRSMGINDLVDTITSAGQHGLLDTGQPWQHTLAASNDRSYTLCSPEEQLLWNRLSVFPDGFDLRSAEAVCADIRLDAVQLPQLLTRLVDQSVLLADTTSGTSRYRMLDSVRASGALRLNESDRSEQQRLRQAHAEHFVDLVRQGTDAIGSSHEIDWMHRIQLEIPNLHVAADFLLAHGQPDQALDLAVELAQTRWAYFAGQLDQARDLLRRTLHAHTTSDNQATPHPLRIAAHVLAAHIDLHQGLHTQAEHELAAADAAAQQLGNPPDLQAWLLLGHGLQLLARRDLSSLTVLREAHDTWRQHAAGAPYPGRGAALFAAALIGDATTARREIDNPQNRGNGSELGDAWVRWCHGVTELRHGSPHIAADLLADTAHRQIKLGDRWGSAWSLEALAWAAASCRHDEHAAVLLGAARHRWTPAPVVTGIGPAADLHDQWTTTTQARLGNEAFAAAVKHGSTLDDVTLLTYLQTLPDLSQHSEQPPGGLSVREYEVAGLIAAGLTNKQIAEKLYVSARTVDTHAESIRQKLGFSGAGARLKIARWWGVHHEH